VGTDIWSNKHEKDYNTQLVICLLSHFIHIWYLGWPWSEHAHIIPISRMVDFCESYSPFHVCLWGQTYGQTNMKRTITLAKINHPWNRYNMRMLRLWSPISHGWLIFARVIALVMFVWPYVRPHILCTQLVICLLSHFIHIWYLGWPWS
jgi:hypothetical protein